MATGLPAVVESVREKTYSRGQFFQLVPALVWYALFLLVPFGIVVLYSFVEDPPLTGGPIALTISNYTDFFGSDLYLSILLESFVLGVKVTAIALFVAYPLTYYLAFTGNGWKNVLLLMVILPFWINVVIRTYAWQLILGRSGVINYFLQNLGLISEPADLLFTQNAIVLGLVYVFLPYMIFPLYTSLDRIDRSHIEAANTLGANRLIAHLEIVLPQSLPGIAGGVVIVFVLAFGSFLVPLLLGGSENIMIANVIGDMFTSFFEWGNGSAIAVVVTVLTLGLIYVFNRSIGLAGLYGGENA